MVACKILVTTSRGDQHLAGTITYEGGKFISTSKNKKYNGLVKGILQDPVLDSFGKPVSQKDTPTAWMMRLPMQYSGSFLRVAIDHELQAHEGHYGRHWKKEEYAEFQKDKRYWVGVDFDATIAEYHDKVEKLGKPIPEIVEIAKGYIKDGITVKIFTARVATASPAQLRKIQKWTKKYLGKKLEITNEKDHFCIAIYDDKAIQVEPNTGKIVGKEPKIEASTVLELPVILAAVAPKKTGPTVNIVVKDPAREKELAEKKKAKKPLTPEEQEMKDLQEKAHKIVNKHAKKHLKEFIKQNSVKAGGPGSGRKKEEVKKILKKKWKNQTEEERRKVARQDSRQLKLPLSGGGPGSGRHKEFGTARHKPILNARQRRAIKSYRPTNMKEQQLAHKGERLVAEHLGGTRTNDSHAFDVVNIKNAGSNHAVEVKNLIQQPDTKWDRAYPRFYMKAPAVARKMAWANDNDAKTHTVVLDWRGKNGTPDVYHKAGVGTSNLGRMTLVKGGLAGLKKFVK